MSAYRNVMLLISDDWSPIAGCYGNEVIRMPSVDALAARGTRFQHAFCTTPSCAASRANLLTGHYSHTHGQYGHCHGIHNFHTHLHMPSIPKALKAAGFTTGLVGKLHVKPPEVYPWDYEAGGGRNVRAMADSAATFLNQVGDQPFYLHVGYADPHRDFGNKQAYPGVEEVTYLADEVIVPDFLPDHPAVRAELAEYYQSVSRLDTGIGMAVQALEESGHVEDTLIVVMSDHGMPFPGAKASSFDTGHHCPLIVVRPDQPEAVVCDALVNWCNIMPTVLEWCGVDAPEGLPERSLMPILDTAHPEGWDETFFSHSFHEVTNYYPYRVLRGRKYKYVRNLYPELTTPLPSDLWASPTWQAVLDEGIERMGKRRTETFLHQDAEALFDIENDPMESTNLIDDPALADVAEEMRQKVKQFRMATEDQWVLASIHAGETGLQFGKLKT